MFEGVVTPIVELIEDFVGPALLLVGALGAVYCVILGVKYAKAEEPQEHEKAKNHLKNAIVGYVLIFVLMVLLKLSTPVLTDWMKNNSSTTAASSTTSTVTVTTQAE